MKRLTVLVLALVAGCASTSAAPSQAAKDADVRVHQRVAQPPVGASPASSNKMAVLVGSSTQVTKVLVFIEENHSIAQMKKGMPKTYALAKQYGYGTTTACAHPSLPNYLCIAFGSTMGVKDDKAPSSHKIKGATVFGQAIAKGKTAATFSQSSPSNCAQTSKGPFAVKHVPLNYAVDERALCRKFSTNSTALDNAIKAGTLPNVGMVIPNLDYDAHDGSLGKADTWFADKVKAIQASKDWKTGTLAIVLTADEDDRKSGNKVLTVVIHPALAHKVVTAPLTHYSLSAALSQISGSTPLLNGKTAPPFWPAFGLVVG